MLLLSRAYELVCNLESRKITFEVRTVIENIPLKDKFDMQLKRLQNQLIDSTKGVPKNKLYFKKIEIKLKKPCNSLAFETPSKISLSLAEYK